jgi:hypothetical protein
MSYYLQTTFRIVGKSREGILLLALGQLSHVALANYDLAELGRNYDSLLIIEKCSEKNRVMEIDTAGPEVILRIRYGILVNLCK